MIKAILTSYEVKTDKNTFLSHAIKINGKKVPCAFFLNEGDTPTINVDKRGIRQIKIDDNGLYVKKKKCKDGEMRDYVYIDRSKAVSTEDRDLIDKENAEKIKALFGNISE